MRLDLTALARVTRKALTATTAAVVVGGATVLTAQTASAATVTADSCTGTVGGRAGDTIAVDGSAVSDLVRQGAEDAKSLAVVHDVTIWPNHLADTIADERLSVATVPRARTGFVDGATIGAAVRQALDGSAGLGALPSTQDTTLDTIEQQVAGDCGFAIESTNHTATATTRSDSDGQPRGDVNGPGGSSGSGSGDSGDSPSPASGDTGGGTAEHDTPGTGPADGGLQGTGDARSPRRGYGDIPVAEAPSAGIAVPPDLRYAPSNGVPGEATTPGFDVLDAESEVLGAAGDESGQGPDEHTAGVRSAGNADALATDGSSEKVRLPMLLAVVALAGVTAGLVRTWVLRRAS